MTSWTFLDRSTAAWADAMLRTCWQGALFALLVWLGIRARPRLRPGIQCWLWWLACGKLLLGLFWITAPTLPLLPAVAGGEWKSGRVEEWRKGPLAYGTALMTSKRGVTEPANTPSGRHLPGAPSPLPLFHSSALPLFHSSIPPLFTLWLIGVAFLAIRALRRSVGMRRLRREACPVPPGDIHATLAELCATAGVRRIPSVLESSLVSSPLVVGLYHPVVILPRGAAEHLPPGELRLILAHEVSHLRRGGLWLALVPALARVLLFFHPLAWIAAREWAAAREMACDSLALSLTGAQPSEYGRMLLRYAASKAAARPLPGLGIVGGYGRLKRRLEMLGQFRSGRPCPASRVGIAVALALAVAAILPWKVTAQNRESGETRTARLAEQWEDVLLLEATRYLRFNREQLASLVPMARTASDRIERLVEENDRSLATVERIARKHREALLRGERVSTVEQQGAVQYGRTLQQKRLEAEEQLVLTLAPRLARLLTREQIQRAYLLALGEWPKGEAGSPALLDPDSGFVLAQDPRSEWLEILRTRDPAHIRDSMATPDNAPATLDIEIKLTPSTAPRITTTGAVSDYAKLNSTISQRDCVACHRAAPAKAGWFISNRQVCPASIRPADGAARRRIADRLVNGATEAELALSLRPLVRRLFFSPRLRPLLAERLGTPVPITPDDGQ